MTRFATHYITWEEACQYIAEGTVDSLSKLARSEEETHTYNVAMDKIRQRYASTADYLHITVFDAPATPGPDGKLVAGEIPQPPEPLGQSAPPVTVWRLNDFPYHFTSDIQHHLLWSTRELPDNDVQAAIAARFPGQPTAYWVNPTELKSVKAIWHAHVLVHDPAHAASNGTTSTKAA